MTFTGDPQLSREHAERAVVAGFIAGGAAVVGGLPAVLLVILPWAAVVGVYAVTAIAFALIVLSEEAAR